MSQEGLMISTIGGLNSAIKSGIVDGEVDLASKAVKNVFTNHRDKQIAAITMTLRVNSRVARVYGKAERRFAHWYRDKELFIKRNESVYVEINRKGEFQVPEDVITKDDAFLLVCMSGECLAEAQGDLIGSGHDQHAKMTLEIDQFLDKYNSILDRIKHEEDSNPSDPPDPSDRDGQ